MNEQVNILTQSFLINIQRSPGFACPSWLHSKYFAIRSELEVTIFSNCTWFTRRASNNSSNISLPIFSASSWLWNWKRHSKQMSARENEHNLQYGGLFFRWILLNLTNSNILVTELVDFKYSCDGFPYKSVKMWKERSECETVKFFKLYFIKKISAIFDSKALSRRLNPNFLVNTVFLRLSHERSLKMNFLIRLITWLITRTWSTN